MIIVDTHLAYWAVADDEKLPQLARTLLSSGEKICFSVVSMWEIELKHRKNPEKMPISGKQFYLACIEAGMNVISIRPRHIFALDNILSDENYHNDPFDHLLLAVAKEEKGILLTHDEKLKHYQSVDVIVC